MAPSTFPDSLVPLYPKYHKLHIPFFHNCSITLENPSLPFSQELLLYILQGSPQMSSL